MTKSEIQEVHVDYSDRHDEVTTLCMSLGALGFHVSYTVADLFHMNIEQMKLRGDKYSIRDTTQLEADWARKWEMYHNNKKKRNEHRSTENIQDKR